MHTIKKIVIAPDSFKGSISAGEAADAIRRGLQKNPAVAPDATLLTTPIADGGEGTLEALVSPQSTYTATVTGTGGDKTNAAYGYIGKTAIIEMARAAGLTLVPEEKRNAATATTYGVGELIAAALDRGFRDILLTAGGSGTNDGGCGMLAALGASFTDESGRNFVPTGGTLDRICAIDLSGLDPRLAACTVTVATDVKNPLLGPEGATYVYARQKGADEAALAKMEAGMKHYAALIQQLCGRDVAIIPGCGAGGGIATPLLAFCGATIRSGIDAVLDAVSFTSLLHGADAVITGEGKIDRQSLYGKAISGVAKAAAAQGIPVYVLVGCIGDDRQALMDMGLADIYAIGDIAPSSAYSMTHAGELLEQVAVQMTFD